MTSKARTADHASSASRLLVAMALGMFAATIVALLAHLGTERVFYYRAGMVTNIVGVLAAVVAIGAGVAELYTMPRDSVDRDAAIRHGAIATLGVCLFGVSAAILWSNWHTVGHAGLLSATVPLAIAVTGMLGIVIAGILERATRDLPLVARGRYL